jgi:hypothetical protein
LPTRSEPYADLPLDLDRKYEVWTYTVSHSRLLLRSPASIEKSSQIDVLFPGVSALHVRAWFDCLLLEMPREDEWAAISTQVGSDVGDKVVYVVSRGPLNYVVAAGPLAWVEYEGMYSDESPLLRMGSSGLAE